MSSLKAFYETNREKLEDKKIDIGDYVNKCPKNVRIKGLEGVAEDLSEQYSLEVAHIYLAFFKEGIAKQFQNKLVDGNTESIILNLTPLQRIISEKIKEFEASGELNKMSGSSLDEMRASLHKMDELCHEHLYQ